MSYLLSSLFLLSLLSRLLMMAIEMNTSSRPVARILRREVTCVSDVNVYIDKHARLGGSGGMLPQENFLEIRCSEIASEAILGQDYVD